MFTFKIARQLLAVAVAAATIGACASAGGSAASGASQQGGSRDRITAVELANAHADNLYDAIQKLRPQFLRGDQNGVVGNTDPGSSAAGGLVTDAVVAVSVYKDNVRLNGLEDLRGIMLSDVKEVRFLRAVDAQIRLGTDNKAGAILITTNK